MTLGCSGLISGHTVPFLSGLQGPYCLLSGLVIATILTQRPCTCRSLCLIHSLPTALIPGQILQLSAIQISQAPSDYTSSNTENFKPLLSKVSPEVAFAVHFQEFMLT